MPDAGAGPREAIPDRAGRGLDVAPVLRPRFQPNRATEVPKPPTRPVAARARTSATSPTTPTGTAGRGKAVVEA